MLKIKLLLTITLISLNTHSSECIRESVELSGVGDIKYSILSPNEFKKVNGDGWVLAKGQTASELGLKQNVSNKKHINNLFQVVKYSKKPLTTYDLCKKGSDNKCMTEDIGTNDQIFQKVILPDTRGLFLRSKNNSRSDEYKDTAGDKKLGSISLDQLVSHTHQYNVAGSKEVVASNSHAGGWSRVWGMKDGGPESKSEETTLTGDGDETSPKHLVVNTYIKVKANCIDKNFQTFANQVMKEWKDDFKKAYKSKISFKKCIEVIPTVNTTTNELEVIKHTNCYSDELKRYEMGGLLLQPSIFKGFINKYYTWIKFHSEKIPESEEKMNHIITHYVNLLQNLK